MTAGSRFFKPRTLIVLVLACVAQQPVLAKAPTATAVLEAAGIRAGLIVHVGCGDGELTARLAADDRLLVHGLDTDAQNVEKARRHAQSLEACGNVSFDRFDGHRLPYVDNLVNCVVAQDLGDVPMSEVMRVLCPGGVALTGDTKAVKSRPDDIDDWTHWLYDASGNAVSRDLVAGPPRHYQWTAPPAWSKHHDTVLATSAMVTAGGRLFSITDRSPSSEFHETSQGNWFLVARDAFNGVLLWEVPIEGWGWQTWGESFTKRFAQPVQLPSRLVADADRVYVTLGFHAPVSVIDAASGEILRTLEATRCADEILLENGRVIATIYDPADEPSKKAIRAVDPADGRLLWQTDRYEGLPARYDAVEGMDPLYVTAYRDRVVFVSKQEIVCLDLESGDPRWKIPRPEYHEHQMNLGVRQSENCSIVNHGEVVIFVQPAGKLPHTCHTVPCDLYAFSADTGRRLWSGKCGTWAWGHQADVFVIDGLAWVHEHIETEMKGPDPVDVESIDHALIGLDLHTGEVRRKIPTSEIFRIGHHHRCYRNKATTRYLFSARRGTETTDFASGRLDLHPWVRSECRLGVVPANGFLYTAPHPCACYAGVSLTGFNALAPERREGERKRETGRGGDGESGVARLERGPAYNPTAYSLQPAASSPSWPTYRQNGTRNGFVPTKVATDLTTRWTANLAGPLTAPVVAGGRVFVAQKERRTLVALDAIDGRTVWKFSAAARIDSPPTVIGPLVAFGCRDGWVYCLTADSGKLVWRFRAAPDERWMVADDRLESVWPVHGSLLAADDEVIALAGRSSYLDGGLYAYRLKLESGQLIERKRINHGHLTEKELLDREASLYDHYYTEGTLADVLSTHGDSVLVKGTAVFGPGLESGPLLTVHSGYLDDSMFERSLWFLKSPGREPIGAQMIVHDNDTAYGFFAYSSSSRGGPWHVIGSGYTLFSAPCGAAESSSPGPMKIDPHVLGQDSRLLRKFTWRQTIPVRARAMVLAENALLVAGTPDVVKPDNDPYLAVEGRLGGRLLVASRADGHTLAEHDLPSPPTWDGMAVTAAGAYISMQDGSVALLGPAE